ncbi:unnamed protein product [Nippostrongylus brasiliensis]|uniref:Uncharacterized protein n=1 Tax=Nippostrongylus brasiliensis TaxID=27835 RepID=A0A0N4XYW9_NIPBR|nr:unnamed protein product [Nippostrongylus brasiliensis]
MPTSISKATATPCCVDTLLPGVCRALYNRDHKKFSARCRLDADFSFIQCCHSCHFSESFFTAKELPVSVDIYRKDAEQLLLADTSKCQDRHGIPFCENFASRQGAWSRTGFGCDHAALAKSPATVVYDADVARDSRKCQRLY